VDYNSFQHTFPSLSLQHTATHCNTLQHTATHCNALQNLFNTLFQVSRYNTPQRTATHCNTLQHTATHCKIFSTHFFKSLATTHRNALQHTATHCNALQILFNTLLQISRYNTLQHTASHCNTLQHTATLCKFFPTHFSRSPISADAECAAKAKLSILESCVLWKFWNLQKQFHLGSFQNTDTLLWRRCCRLTPSDWSRMSQLTDMHRYESHMSHIWMHHIPHTRAYILRIRHDSVIRMCVCILACLHIYKCTYVCIFCMYFLYSLSLYSDIY